LLKTTNGKIACLKTKTLPVKSKLREVKRRAEDDDTPNNSMDVRAKQRLSYQRLLVTFSLRGGGFAPRHLNRWAAKGFDSFIDLGEWRE